VQAVAVAGGTAEGVEWAPLSSTGVHGTVWPEPGWRGTPRTSTDVLRRPSRGSGIPNRHACAVLDTGRLKCWGENWKGQLGYGDTIRRGDEAGEVSAGRCRSGGAGGKMQQGWAGPARG